MWGTHSHTYLTQFFARFIPTHVGNARKTEQTMEQQTVHPHACGERYFDCRKSKRNSGSSPRMWGTQTQENCHEVSRRFIPTHVGNAVFKCAANRIRAVHPHACGERSTAAVPMVTMPGSSPRMWGTHLMQLLDLPKEKEAAKFYRFLKSKNRRNQSAY